MSGLILHLTDAGLAAVQGASGSDPVVIAQLGLTATPFDIAPTLTALPGEFKRIAAVAGQASAANITHMTAYDTSAEAWLATGLGLFLADGTLFAVYSQPTTIIAKASPAFALIAFDIAWQADYAGSIAFGDPVFTSPPATTEARGIVELATLAEAQAGADALRALTPSAAAGAVLTWLLARDGAGSGLDADLLDGQHGAWYADIPARLGFNPLNAASYTAADVLAKLLGVDGSGSNLDADFLDGQHGAWYADIPARLGFNPLNAATFTAANVLAMMREVDGSGSNLDADFLDGQQGSWYADIIGRLGFTPANKAGDTFTGAVFVNGDIHARRPGTNTGVIYLNDDATRWLYFNGTEYILQGAPLRVNGGLAWSDANDGSGSGLDADLLDGLQGSAYLRIVESQLAANGYLKFSNGFYLMWGTRSFSGSGSTTVVNYAAELGAPIALSAFSIALVNAGRTTDTDANPAYVTGADTFGFSAFNRSSAATTGFWIAVGA